jgi:hypothetical protein
MEEGVAVKAAAPPTAVRAIAAESFMVEVLWWKDLCQLHDDTHHACGKLKILRNTVAV